MSFQDVNVYDPVFWDSIPDMHQHLAWPVDDIRWATSAVLISLESGEERKRLYSISSGSPTRVGVKSALCIGSDIIYVQGSYAARLDVANWRIAWRVDLDLGSCFGVYADPDDPSAVIIHGELEISKLSLNGDILWKVGGADIFVEPEGSTFILQNHTVKTRDWNGSTYTIDTTTGHLIAQASGQKPDEGAPPDAR
jgi:hypothetical protein